MAEVAEKYVHKGDILYIEGKIRTRSYDDPSGAKRYITEIFADSMEMLTPKGGNQSYAPQQAQPQSAPVQSQPVPQDNSTDDLPF